MVITRQTMIQGRHSLPSGIDIAMRKTLAGLPEKQVGKQHSAHRGITLAACAAVVVFGVAVASIPSAKAYAEGLFRSVFGLFAGEPDNGIAPPVQSDSPSAYEQGEQVKYKILSANSVPVNVWQTSNGVTATVLEAAVAEDKLFMGLEFTGLPQYCYPAEEFIHVWVDGKQMDTGDTRKDSTINEADIFTVEHPLTVQQEKLPQNFTVRLSFNLRQFPDGGFGKGNVIASFDMSFAMSKPTVFASLPPDSVGVSIQNDGPSVTGVPQKEGIALDDPYLREPDGVSDWAKYDNSQAAVSFEYPKAWNPIHAPWPLKSDGAVLAAYKGSSGGVIVYAVQLDAAKPADAADFVTAYLLKEGAEGHAYDAKGGQVYYLRDTSTCSLRTDAGGGTEKSYQSYVIVKPNHPVSVNGKTYNYLLIYAPMDFNTHILKSLVIG